MPYDAYGNYIKSTANNTTDTLGFDAIGGIGQLIYHLVRFKKYETDYRNDDYIARPYCQPGYEPSLYDEDSFTGKELLVSIYNLAKKIDDSSEEKSYPDLIIEWCQEYGHPYAVDAIYRQLMDDNYNIDVDGFSIEQDGTFSIDGFMKDLERIYQVMRMLFAFDQMCLGNDEAALSLYEDGRYFAGLPFFEKFRHDPEDIPDIDVSAAKGDLLKEMLMEKKAQEEEPDYEYDDFSRVPFDYNEQLQETLVDLFPDFRIRLKIDPRTRKAVFAADVNSVFDICWYTLARRISEDVAPDDRGTSIDRKEEHEGVVLSCPFCGEAYIRRGNRSVTCGKPECTRARKRMNQQNSRRKRKIEAQQSK